MMIVFATLLDTILRVMKNILVNRKSKLIASFVNSSLYLCNALMIKYIANTDTWQGLAIVIPTSFIGCWLAMSIIEKLSSKNIKN